MGSQNDEQLKRTLEEGAGNTTAAALEEARLLEAESEQIPQVSLKTHRYSLEPRLLTFNLNVSLASFKMFSNKACRM